MDTNTPNPTPPHSTQPNPTTDLQRIRLGEVVCDKDIRDAEQLRLVVGLVPEQDVQETLPCVFGGVCVREEERGNRGGVCLCVVLACGDKEESAWVCVCREHETKHVHSHPNPGLTPNIAHPSHPLPPTAPPRPPLPSGPPANTPVIIMSCRKEFREAYQKKLITDDPERIFTFKDTLSHTNARFMKPTASAAVSGSVGRGLRLRRE